MFGLPGAIHSPFGFFFSLRPIQGRAAHAREQLPMGPRGALDPLLIFPSIPLGISPSIPTGRNPWFPRIQIRSGRLCRNLHYFPVPCFCPLKQLTICLSLVFPEALLKAMITKYTKTSPKLAAWLEQNVPEALTVFCLPPEHRTRMRTSNSAERVNQEIKRRTRVVRVFPNIKSLLRLVTAVLNDINDRWETSKCNYLNMNPPSQHYAA